MINYILKIIVGNELRKIEASSELLFHDILCNKYNNKNPFPKVANVCCGWMAKHRN